MTVISTLNQELGYFQNGFADKRCSDETWQGNVQNVQKESKKRPKIQLELFLIKIIIVIVITLWLWEVHKVHTQKK